MKNVMVAVGDLVRLAIDDGHIYRVDFIEAGIAYCTSTTDPSRGIVRSFYTLVWA